MDGFQVAAQFAGVICIAWQLRAFFRGTRPRKEREDGSPTDGELLLRAPRWASVSVALRRFVTTAGAPKLQRLPKTRCLSFQAV